MGWTRLRTWTPVRHTRSGDGRHRPSANWPIAIRILDLPNRGGPYWLLRQGLHPDALPTPRVDVRTKNDLPTGTYFADWALPEARRLTRTGYASQTIRTTLDSRLQAVVRAAQRGLI